MSIQSRIYYWIECDRPGCDATSPSQDDFEDTGMWDNSRQAISDAQESGWTLTLAGELFCVEHGAIDEDPLEATS